MCVVVLGAEASGLECPYVTGERLERRKASLIALLSADWVLGSGGRWVWPRTPTQRGASDNLLAVERERDGLLLPSPSSQRTQPLLICLFVFVLVFLGCRSLQSPVWGTGDIR